MAGKFWYPSHWRDLGDAAFNYVADPEHTEHGFSPDFVARQEDRDRYLEDYLNGLAAAAGGKRYATVVVAASNSQHNAQADADYVCTGTGDEATIQAACNAVSSSNNAWPYGTVLLMEGQYNLSNDAAITGGGVELVGMGPNVNGSHIVCGTITTANRKVLSGFARVADLGIALNASPAVVFSLIQAGTYGVQNCTLYFAGGVAGALIVDLGNTSQAPIINCSIQGNQTATGIACVGGAALECRVINNFLRGGIGVSLTGTAQYNTIIGNTMDYAVESAIVLGASTLDNLVIGNSINGHGDATHDCISVAGTRNAVVNNIVRKDTASPRYGINVLAGATDSYVTNNDLKLSGVTGSFLDSGTGTITTAGNRL